MKFHLNGRLRLVGSMYGRFKMVRVVFVLREKKISGFLRLIAMISGRFYGIISSSARSRGLVIRKSVTGY